MKFELKILNPFKHKLLKIIVDIIGQMEIEVVQPLIYCPDYLLGLLMYCDKGL